LIPIPCSQKLPSSRILNKISFCLPRARQDQFQHVLRSC
jgi:hypothetical protein